MRSRQNCHLLGHEWSDGVLTLLLRLAGPLQSWGTASRFRERETGREPSKSGVVGLIAAALGRARTEPINDLATLALGVRVNREGTLQRDYQTVGGTHLKGRRYAHNDPMPHPYGVAEFDGAVKKEAVITNRYYLADADFLVGLEAQTHEQEDLLGQIDRALLSPVWPLSLGRKAFVPGHPVRLPDMPPLGPGLRERSLREVLLHYPWPQGIEALRFVFDDPTGQSGVARQDIPISFDALDRRYQTRFISTEYLPRPADVPDEMF
jgi:CRISPR system Cascade subunit CasD